MNRQHLPNLIIIAILGLGTLARLTLLGLQRFHEDEALYSSWGLRIASGEDMWLARIPADKPPLFFYLQASVFALLGPSETAARLPSLVASLISIGLLYLLVQRLWDQPTALTAAALLAASPFAISFAPTAFLDPLMGMWVLAACLAVTRGRWGWAGVLLGLAGATKWEGWAFLPLVVGLGVCLHSSPGSHAQPTTRVPLPQREGAGKGEIPSRSPDDPVRPFHSNAIIHSLPTSLWQGEGIRSPHNVWVMHMRLTLGLLAIVALVGCWDLARPQPSILQQLRANYGGLALAPPEMWGERLRGWASLLQYAFYHPWLNAIFLAGLSLLLLADLISESANPRICELLAHSPIRPFAHSHVDLLLVTFLILFLAALTLLRIPLWDRYLLALVPFGCLLLARVLWLPRRFLTRSSEARFALSILVTVLLLCTLPLPMRDAAAGRFPIGGDHGAYQGIEQVVAYFRGHVMGGAILYHRWLGHHYQFYMYRFPYAFRWWRTPEELAQDAVTAADVERWIVFPNWQDEGPARIALAARGLRLIPRHRIYRDDGSLSFTIYQIEGP